MPWIQLWLSAVQKYELWNEKHCSLLRRDLWICGIQFPSISLEKSHMRKEILTNFPMTSLSIPYIIGGAPTAVIVCWRIPCNQSALSQSILNRNLWNIAIACWLSAATNERIGVALADTAICDPAYALYTKFRFKWARLNCSTTVASLWKCNNVLKKIAETLTNNNESESVPSNGEQLASLPFDWLQSPAIRCASKQLCNAVAMVAAKLLATSVGVIGKMLQGVLSFCADDTMHSSKRSSPIVNMTFSRRIVANAKWVAVG